MRNIPKSRLWVKRFAEAMAQRDPLKIPGLIEAARQAIHGRAAELAKIEDSPEHEAESRALEDALRDLWEHEYRHQH